jgi:hypothetical protein
MGDIQGLGLTHYPGLLRPDRDMTIFLQRTLAGGKVPPALADPARWPARMREEWGSDRGASAAPEHRARLLAAFRRLRSELDAFRPDFVVIFGDDQYENFREEIVPPFCVFILGDIVCTPFAPTDGPMLRDNAYGEPPDRTFAYTGHPGGGRHLARRLIEEGFDIPYAYRLRDPRGLSHAFANTLLFLDEDRRGFPYPVVPFHVNCYGSSVIRRRGGLVVPGGADGEPDPPSPTPARCFDVGRALGRILRDSPWRVSVIASSSWSHAFLTEKHGWLYPDVASDRARFEELKAGQQALWRGLTTAQIEDAGQHEFLNWVCWAGAMTELGRTATIVDYVESYVFNSDKCFAAF